MQGIIFGDHPPKGIHFEVRVDLNYEHPIYNGMYEAGDALISSPISTFPLALEMSEGYARSFASEKLNDAKVVEVDPEAANGYHYLLNDDAGSTMASVTVEMIDYRNETIH